MAAPGWKVTVLAAREKLMAVTRPTEPSTRVSQRPGRREARANMRGSRRSKTRSDRNDHNRWLAGQASGGPRPTDQRRPGTLRVRRDADALQDTPAGRVPSSNR